MDNKADQNILHILEEFSIFCDLTAEELLLIAPLCSLNEGKAGDRIIREGELVQNLHVIVSGEALVKKARADGKEVLIGSLGKDDLIGEITFFKGTPASATVEAKAAYKTVVINQKALHRFLEKQAQLGMKIYKNFARVMSGRLKTVNAKLADSVKAS